MAVAHVALDLRPGGEGRHRVHHHHVDGAGAHQGLADLQPLLAGVRLGDEHGVDVHPQGAGIGGVQGVLRVDVGHLAPPLLGLGHDVQGQGGFAGGLGAIDFNDTPLGYAADAQGDVQRQRPGWDGLNHDMGVLPQAHDGALAILLLNLGDGGGQRLLLIRRRRGGLNLLFLLSHVRSSFPAGIFQNCRPLSVPYITLFDVP